MGRFNQDSSSDQLAEIGIQEFLEHDPRPTFVLDLDPESLHVNFHNSQLDLVLCNEALRSYDALLDAITGEPDHVENTDAERVRSAEFRSWARSITKFDDSRDVYPSTHIYRNMLWTGSTIRKRWRVISGNQYYQTSSSPDSSSVRSDSIPFINGKEPSVLRRRSSRDDHTHPSSTRTQTKTRAVERYDSINVPPTSIPPDEILRKQARMSSRSSIHTGKTAESTLSLTLSTPENGTPDWTVPKPKGQLSDHLLFVRSIDWASTPLGAMKHWSAELRQVANLVMLNPHPAALFWGNDLTVLYNRAYRDEVAGNKHPSMMGSSAEASYGEVWAQISPLFAECARTGVATRRDNDYLPIERHGYLEETYFSWSFTPLYGGCAKVLGFYNAPFETTRDYISHRRMQTLQRLGTSITSATSVKHFWKNVLLGLEDGQQDVPFALLYSVMDSDDADEVSVSSGSTLSLKSCVLEGSIAVPPGHPASPSKLDLKRSREGFIPSFREAMRTRQPTQIQVRDGTLPESLLEGIEWRGFGEPCKEAIIFPLRPTNGDSVLAFLLVGVNPRRPYDDDYIAFANLMNRQLATALASVMLFENEMKRSQSAIVAATLQQEQLNEQLAVQTNRLERMTALSPLGMFYIDPTGLILEANDRYYEMTAQNRNDLRAMGWMDQLVDSSRSTMADGWQKLTVDRVTWTAELQLKTRRFDPVNPNPEVIDNWVLATSQPEIGPDGQVRSIMGCITDISYLKWAQGLQERRLREADERRRQQNEFIDITSHEMRNPLSAILQCADDIISTMTECGLQSNDSDIAPTIASCIESANTIALCVQHQKSIVDDILTVSKLDSNLLELAPIPCRPKMVVKGVMKMFEPELIAKKIKFSVIIRPDYEQLGIDWVSMDPSRISQVLINLMTNAIKFTNDRPTREIHMHIAASSTIPYETNTTNFQYIPRRSNTVSAALGKAWSADETVYIRIKVVDTGCGLSSEEKQSLFERFQQASPRTHAQYGGSGLGLFISRQLTELHGGQMGVASEVDVGSTFGFYIRTRRVSPPIEEQLSPRSSTGSLHLTLNNLHRPNTPSLIASHIQKESRRIVGVDKPYLHSNTQLRSVTSSPLHVLVVEDNLVNQKVLVRQLQKGGCIVHAADNGQKALDFLDTTIFRLAQGGLELSIVLMDLEMPVMDGLTCIRRIRQLEKEGTIRHHVPVIAVTANVRLEQVLAAKSAGMDDVVSKPFRIPELLTKINSLLRRDQMADASENKTPVSTKD